MISCDDELNSWKSLADFLSKIDVATLATAIEEKGIYTWDRFGRMTEATKDADDLYSQARALDLLALVYKSAIEVGNDKEENDLDDFIHDFEGPLVRFGWPSNDCPDFEKYKSKHPLPKTISQAGPPHEDDLLGTRERRSLYAIIRALMKMDKFQTPVQPYKVAPIIAPQTCDENETNTLHPNTVASHLRRIYGLR